MFSLTPLVYVADLILNAVFNFVVFYILGAFTVPFILILSDTNGF